MYSIKSLDNPIEAIAKFMEDVDDMASYRDKSEIEKLYQNRVISFQLNLIYKKIGMDRQIDVNDWRIRSLNTVLKVLEEQDEALLMYKFIGSVERNNMKTISILYNKINRNYVVNEENMDFNDLYKIYLS